MTTPAQELGDLQLALLRALWREGEGTTAQLQEALADTEGRDLAITTIATVLQRMEKRGLVAHRTEGRQFVYHALVSEAELRSSLVSGVAERAFGGDVSEFVCHLLTSDQLKPGDLEKIKALIAKYEEQSSGGVAR